MSQMFSPLISGATGGFGAIAGETEQQRQERLRRMQMLQGTPRAGIPLYSAAGPIPALAPPGPAQQAGPPQADAAGPMPRIFNGPTEWTQGGEEDFQRIRQYEALANRMNPVLGVEIGFDQGREMRQRQANAPAERSRSQLVQALLGQDLQNQGYARSQEMEQEGALARQREQQAGLEKLEGIKGRRELEQEREKQRFQVGLIDVEKGNRTASDLLRSIGEYVPNPSQVSTTTQQGGTAPELKGDTELNEITSGSLQEALQKLGARGLPKETEMLSLALRRKYGADLPRSLMMALAEQASRANRVRGSGFLGSGMFSSIPSDPWKAKYGDFEISGTPARNDLFRSYNPLSENRERFGIAGPGIAPGAGFAPTEPLLNRPGYQFSAKNPEEARQAAMIADVAAKLLAAELRGRR